MSYGELLIGLLIPIRALFVYCKSKKKHQSSQDTLAQMRQESEPESNVWPEWYLGRSVFFYMLILNFFDVFATLLQTMALLELEASLFQMTAVITLILLPLFEYFFQGRKLPRNYQYLSLVCCCIGLIMVAVAGSLPSLNPEAHISGASVGYAIAGQIIQAPVYWLEQKALTHNDDIHPLLFGSISGFINAVFITIAVSLISIN